MFETAELFVHLFLHGFQAAAVNKNFFLTRYHCTVMSDIRHQTALPSEFHSFLVYLPQPRRFLSPHRTGRIGLTSSLPPAQAGMSVQTTRV